MNKWVNVEGRVTAQEKRWGLMAFSSPSWRVQLSPSPLSQPPPPLPSSSRPCPSPPTHLVQVLRQRLLQKLLVLLQEAAQALQLGSPELSRPCAPRAEGLPQPLQRVCEGVHPAGRGSMGRGAPPPGALHRPCLHPRGPTGAPMGTHTSAQGPGLPHLHIHTHKHTRRGHTWTPTDRATDHTS